MESGLFFTLQAVSIVGEEVFSFKLSLFPGATEGDGYGDMSKVDGKVTLRLGCIHIVYLHKFLMSLLVRSVIFLYTLNAHSRSALTSTQATPKRPDDCCLCVEAVGLLVTVALLIVMVLIG